MKKLAMTLVAIMCATLVLAPLAAVAAQSADKPFKIAMLPRVRGENYFDACKTGADEAVEELKAKGIAVEFVYDGPPQDQATNQMQVNIIEGWVAQGFDAIIVSPMDAEALAPTLTRAREAGVFVIAFDADAAEGSRDLFVNQATADAVGRGLLTAVADSLRPKGYGPDHIANLSVIGCATFDVNGMAWLASIKEHLKTDEFSWIVIQDESKDISFLAAADFALIQQEAAATIGRLGPNSDQIQAVIAVNSFSAAALGAAYNTVAVRPDASAVTLTGLATPSGLAPYILDEAHPMDRGVLWNVVDLGYLSLMTAYQLLSGEITVDSSSITTSRLGTREIINTEVLLGDALIFDATNVETFDY